MAFVYPVLLTVIVGLIAAVMLALAAKFMAVPVDETAVAIRGCLPGANCGACGFAGCDDYAAALAADHSIKTNLCVPGADAVAAQIAGILGVEIDEGGAEEIASRSRGTPRIANRLLRRVRDFAQVTAEGRINRKVADEALSRMEVDKLGLDSLDRKMLRAIIDYYNGGPVGLDTLAATINEESVTLEDVYEPYLLQIGMMTRTQRGRCVTRLAYEHLGLEFNGQQQLEM